MLNTTSMMVTGVTGRLGGEIVRDLRQAAPRATVAGLARDPQAAAPLSRSGIDVRRGDYENVDSLISAFHGIDVLMMISSPDVTPGTRPRQHDNVIRAAEAAGVRRVVYTSAIGAGDGPEFLADHRVTEDTIRQSTLSWTILRNSFYADSFLNGLVQEARDSGRILGADRGQRAVLATIGDLAHAASACVSETGHENQVYELRGQPFTLAEVAEHLSAILGTPVLYRAVEPDEVANGAFVHRLIASGLLAEPSQDLATLLDRPPTSVRDILSAAAHG